MHLSRGKLAILKLVEQFSTPLSLDNFLIVCSVVLFSILFVLYIEPCSHLFFDALRPRFKIQGYFICIFESVIEEFVNHIFDVEIEGLDLIDPSDFALVISNHQGLLDYFVLIELSRISCLDSSCFFFVWKHCVHFPTIPVLFNWWRHCLEWRIPVVSLTEIFSPILESPWRNYGGKWVCIFPEVCPFTASRAVEHRIRCQDNYCPVMENLLYPRFNSFVQSMDFFRDNGLNCVYDVTIVYEHQSTAPPRTLPTTPIASPVTPGLNGLESNFEIPSLFDLLFSTRKYKLKLKVSKYSLNSIPHKPKHMVKWLEKLWLNKDAFIKQKRETDSTELL